MGFDTVKTDMELRQERETHLRAARQIGKTLRERKRKAHEEPKRRKGRGCGLDRDLAAMALRGFKDPGSYIRRSDGGEVLKGQDWLNRKVELRERSGCRCEYVLSYTEITEDVPVRCIKAATIPAHIIPRHPRRDDRMSNLKHYCFEHDRLTEKQSWRKVRSGKVGA